MSGNSAKTRTTIKNHLKKGLILAILVASGTMAYADEMESTVVRENGTANVLDATTSENQAAREIQVGDEIQSGDQFSQLSEDSGTTNGLDSARSEIGTVDVVEVAPLSEQEEFLQKLHDEFDLTKTEYYQLANQVKETRSKLESNKEEVSELQTQLNYFDDQIELASTKFLSALKQMTKTENEIVILFNEIDIKETALKSQKALLGEYITQLYVHGDTYLSLGVRGEIDAFKLLLADDDTGEILKEIQYLGVLEEAGARLVGRLDTMTEELRDSYEALEEKRLAYSKLEKQLKNQKELLETQKESKENLLQITKAQDEIYRELLRQSVEEQQESFAEVQAFKDSILFIEEKIAEEGDAFDVSKYEDLVGKRFMSVYEFQKNTVSSEGFVWAVSPKRGISAYFRDPSYRAYFGVGHNAIDIRASQGTPVRAVTEGVVYRAKDNGYGYSYITLVHHDGLMTNYGHVSEISVEEGQVVYAGEVIGLSGGMPGTKGAGYMTTGPHLHLEFIANGDYTDPLRYLPLEVLDEESAHALPESYWDDWERAILE